MSNTPRTRTNEFGRPVVVLTRDPEHPGGYVTTDGRFTVRPWYNTHAAGRGARGERQWSIVDTTGATPFRSFTGTMRDTTTAPRRYDAADTITAAYRREGVIQ